MIWADRVGAEELNIVVDDEQASDLARRALDIDLDVVVWRVDGTDLRRAKAIPALEVPLLSSVEWALAGLISGAGARPVDDHGRLVAEVAGLEVARVVVVDGEVELQVGVGQADRELHSLVHFDMEPDTAMRRAVSAVLEHRRPGAALHPLGIMARERWIRSALVDEPSLVGALTLEPIPPLRPRETVLGNVPSAAMGRSETGASIVVVCSIGVDPDLVPEAADYRRREDAEAELVIVVPERDRYGVTERMVARLDRASLHTMVEPWL